MPLNVNNPIHGGHGLFVDHIAQKNPFIGQVNLVRRPPSAIGHIGMLPLGKPSVPAVNMLTNGDATRNHLLPGSPYRGVHTSSQLIGGPQLIDLEVIAETMRKYFGIHLKPMEGPRYRKPYPEWVDKMVHFHKGYKMLDFTTFSGENGKSTLEHVAQFMNLHGEGS